MKKLFFASIISWIFFSSCSYTKNDLLLTNTSTSDLKDSSLAQKWDEAMPLGNGTVGALIWEKDSTLRFSLDRTDLWDLRPMDSISGPNNKFSWVKEHISKKDYLPVQKKYDLPYEKAPAPSKIPGAALEFNLKDLGKPSNVHLFLKNALCEVSWDNGTIMQTFVHATKPIGWFVFHNLENDLIPQIVAPQYENNDSEIIKVKPVNGQDLRLLKYKQGDIKKEGNQYTYHQKGWGDFSYDVVVKWVKKGSTLYGVWSISSTLSKEKASEEVNKALENGLENDYQSHLAYWDNYWNQSSISIPDSILQKQYQNEMYKFGSAARENSYPISLQSVWTADNSKLPPWKGDYHHDLNTQLSYWPSYIGNHLTEEKGYLNTLWNQRETYKKYTLQYFDAQGLNIPGVCTLTGEPMGGWIQYSMSQTVSAWLAQHFYLHWKYSQDRDFLKDRAYPFLKDVALFLEDISTVNKQGVRTLAYSSSPEIFDNSLQAWFKTMTNYDLSLMKFLFKATNELATELGLEKEAKHWSEISKQLPELDVDKEGALTFANGFPYNQSHRHFSHAMAIHPLGLIDWNNSEEDKEIIKATINKLDSIGPKAWCGYSYSWLGNMKARAMDGNGAAKALKIFAQCFCKKNTFHVNGDQTKSGKSGFTYDPFTLEGNFAFASGIQEMLLQSHTGVIRIFPAIPDDWKNVSFTNLRAMGAFLVSADKQGEKLKIRILSEKGGVLKVQLPNEIGVKTFETKAGQTIDLFN